MSRPIYNTYIILPVSSKSCKVALSMKLVMVFEWLELYFYKNCNIVYDCIWVQRSLIGKNNRKCTRAWVLQNKLPVKQEFFLLWPYVCIDDTDETQDVDMGVLPGANIETAFRYDDVGKNCDKSHTSSGCYVNTD